MILKPGMLDRRLKILREEETGRTPLNEPIYEWVAQRTVWAQKTSLRADSQFSEDSLQRYSATVATFRIWWTDDLLITDRVEVEGITYVINGIVEIGRKIGLEITAEHQT